jgi:hypothetical protein
MCQNHEGFPVHGVNSDQFICKLAPHLRISDKLLKFLVQKGVFSVPVNTGMNIGEKEPDKVNEKSLQNIFPGGIIIGLIGHEKTPLLKIDILTLGVFTVPVKGLETKRDQFFFSNPLILKISFFGRIQTVA